MEINIRNIKYNDFYKKYIDLISELSNVESVNFDLFNKYIKIINDNKHHNIYVIEFNNIIVASITILFEQKITRGFKKVAHIEDVVVKKNFRNKGLCRKMIAFCINLSKQNNCYKIILNCNNDLVSVYKKYGFNNKNKEMSIYL